MDAILSHKLINHDTFTLLETILFGSVILYWSNELINKYL